MNITGNNTITISTETYMRLLDSLQDAQAELEELRSDYARVVTALADTF